MSDQLILEYVLAGLMRRYIKRVPDVSKIISEMIKTNMIASGSDICNDHIAFRCLGIQHLGIASLEKIFLKLGYVKKDYLYFKEKKLNAFWYSPPKSRKSLARVFISECRLNEFSLEAQQLVAKYTNHIKKDPVDELDLTDKHAIDHFLHHRLWPCLSWEDYHCLVNESEYLAWVMNNRYYLNHFTISIHQLPKPYNQLDVFNDFLLSIGITLNQSGGIIKKSKDSLLLQSASIAAKTPMTFPLKKGGHCVKYVPGSYVEFAQRINGRDGFDSENADKIFESTYLK